MRNLVAKVVLHVPKRVLVAGGTVVAICVAIVVFLATDSLAPEPLAALGATMIYGYARVSTDGQTLDAQRDALGAAGAARIFEETESGARTDRRQLARALK